VEVTGAAGGLFSGVLGSKAGQFGIGAVGSTIGAAGGALAGSINIGKAFTVDGILNGKIITNPSSVVKNIGGGAKKIGNSVAKPFKPIKKIKFW